MSLLGAFMVNTLPLSKTTNVTTIIIARSAVVKCMLCGHYHPLQFPDLQQPL